MLNFLLVILLSAVFVFPQSFWLAKVPVLASCLLLITFNGVRGAYLVRSPAAVLYYLGFGIISVIWALVGALRGNADQALIEASTMYVLYMLIYSVLVLHVSNCNYQPYVKSFLAAVSIGVSFFCFYVLADFFFHLNWFGPYVKDQMYLGIGIHDGYVQMNNVNVGMFTFLIPFLIAVVVMEGSSAGRMVLIALMLAITAVVLASRRIVFVLIALAPALTWLISRLVVARQEGITGRCMRAYSAMLIVAASLLLGLYVFDEVAFLSFAGRATEIFVVDQNSVRQLQHQALVEGFFDYPWIGSGFGGLVDVVRSFERPWTYELTYSKVLFNSGLLGTTLLCAFFGYFLWATILKINVSPEFQTCYVPLVVGFLSIMIAAASNPYLSSFDFLYALSILPLILNSSDGGRRDTQVIQREQVPI